MAIQFEWEMKEDVRGPYRECRLELDETKLLMGLRARVKTVEEESGFEWEDEDRPGTRIEQTEISEAFYPALDAIFPGQFLRIAGAFPDEARPMESDSYDQMFNKAIADSQSDARAVPSDPSSSPKSRVERLDGEALVQKVKRTLPVREETIEDAEATLRRFIREFIADLREDAQAVQDAWGGDILTVTQVAELFCVPRNTVLSWIKTGSLRAFRLGSKWMIRRQDLAAAMQESGQRQVKA